MKNVISLSKLFNNTKYITGRNSGEILRDKILKNQEKVIIDFSNIDMITQSFADEVFGIIVRTKGINFIKEKIKFNNINEFNKNIIKWVISYSLK